MSESVKIAGIEIEIGENTIKLTTEQAKELHDALDKLFRGINNKREVDVGIEIRKLIIERERYPYSWWGIKQIGDGAVYTLKVD